MLTAVLLMLAVQDPPQTITWSERAPETPVVEAATKLPDVPGWALADPYGYERAECSPLVRREPTMEACQTRVRADLAAHLGDALPAGLKPAELEDCSPAAAASGGYAVSCMAPRRDRPDVRPQEQRVCANRPVRQGNGVVAWTDECQAEPGEREGLTIPLFGDRD